MADVSVVIRAYNEARELQRLMEQLQAQEFDGQTQLIVVDNGSTDDTAAVARGFGAEVVTLPQEQFSYPRSLNLGIEHATAPVVVCIVAHAYPENRRWLAAAVQPFADPRVAGVWAYALPHRDAPVWDRLMAWPGVTLQRLQRVAAIRRVMMGSFGATNLVLRRSLWERHPFDEHYGAGGEDTVWAKWAMAQGYKILRVHAFTVRHSHYMRTWKQFRQQTKLWASFGGPRQFNPEEVAFRKKFR